MTSHIYNRLNLCKIYVKILKIDKVKEAVH